MISRLAVTPVRYSPDVERLEADEAETSRKIAETMISICETTYENSGHGSAPFMPKATLLAATFEVLDDLPPELAQGLFAGPGRYEAVLRLSTTPGDLLHDSVSTPRGMALKILNVEGPRLPGSARSTSQDFVMVNSKEFNSPSGKAFLQNARLLAATTDRMEGAKEVISKVFKTVEGALERVGKESAALKALGGNPETHILGESFFAQLPLRYGDYIAKIGVVPASANLKALTGTTVDTGKDPDVIRHETQEFFTRETAVWHLQVQLCTDLDAMPVEGVDAWDEAKSPFITVATLTVGPQQAWSEELSRQVDDGMLFSPWNGLAAHQPLGSIMRLRKLSYERSAAFRSERNETSVREPLTCPFGHAFLRRWKASQCAGCRHHSCGAAADIGACQEEIIHGTRRCWIEGQQAAT